jgi:hypothetical protein
MAFVREGKRRSYWIPVDRANGGKTPVSVCEPLARVAGETINAIARDFGCASEEGMALAPPLEAKESAFAGRTPASFRSNAQRSAPRFSMRSPCRGAAVPGRGGYLFYTRGPSRLRENLFAGGGRAGPELSR